ncbi:hypothetical protein N0V93_006675 [Gnomoniopsis smithogilvyi]|uniref:Uncharacterized protein n=1 Tax=Gnomoniopsis smithogilvyi TaxID=1191159 RepID=A0A9W9CVY2_9PEZI|nr:hypothetical protein N0V93_006675 [Gnomoniopsis smithogilvyi]
MLQSAQTPICLAPTVDIPSALAGTPYLVAEAVHAEGSTVTVLVPVALEVALVSELPGELLMFLLAADVDLITVAPEDVAGPSTTRFTVAFAVVLTQIMDRTQDVAATQDSSEKVKSALVMSPLAQTGS